MYVKELERANNFYKKKLSEISGLMDHFFNIFRGLVVSMHRGVSKDRGVRRV